MLRRKLLCFACVVRVTSCQSPIALFPRDNNSILLILISTFLFWFDFYRLFFLPTQKCMFRNERRKIGFRNGWVFSVENQLKRVFSRLLAALYLSVAQSTLFSMEFMNFKILKLIESIYGLSCEKPGINCHNWKVQSSALFKLQIVKIKNQNSQAQFERRMQP